MFELELWDMCWIHFRCEGSQAFDVRLLGEQLARYRFEFYSPMWLQTIAWKYDLSRRAFTAKEEVTVIGSSKASRIKLLTFSMKPEQDEKNDPHLFDWQFRARTSRQWYETSPIEHFDSHIEHFTCFVSTRFRQWCFVSVHNCFTRLPRKQSGVMAK